MPLPAPPEPKPPLTTAFYQPVATDSSDIVITVVSYNLSSLDSDAISAAINNENEILRTNKSGVSVREMPPPVPIDREKVRNSMSIHGNNRVVIDGTRPNYQYVQEALGISSKESHVVHLIVVDDYVGYRRDESDSKWVSGHPYGTSITGTTVIYVAASAMSRREQLMPGHTIVHEILHNVAGIMDNDSTQRGNIMSQGNGNKMTYEQKSRLRSGALDRMNGILPRPR